jgi:release factor glutamine methyltransferase
MVADVIDRGGFADGRDVLDVGTGSGALAVVVARSGARSVTAVDLSYRSVAATWLNARLHGQQVEVRRGDLFEPVAGRRFGLLVANPPYVPAASADLPRHARARCWDGGLDGRAVLDRVCAGAADVLAPGGDALIVHSTVCGVDESLAALQRAGLTSEVLARAVVPFGPVMRSRAAMLRARGLISAGQTTEELVVIGAHRG